MPSYAPLDDSSSRNRQSVSFIDPSYLENLVLDTEGEGEITENQQILEWKEPRMPDRRLTSAPSLIGLAAFGNLFGYQISHL